MAKSRSPSSFAEPLSAADAETPSRLERLAETIFVNAWRPNLTGHTIEHIAELSFAAAKAFLEVANHHAVRGDSE